jgi:hypothetical protein
VPPGAPQLRIGRIDHLVIFRVGYRPDSWKWTPWTFSPFTGRWDDPLEQYRALYAGTSAFACYVEVLAQFRPDPEVVVEMAEIADDPIGPPYPTLPAGIVPPNWFAPRVLGHGQLKGGYVDVQHTDSIANLRPTFIAQALAAGLMDFDGAVVRAPERRPLTGAISRHIYSLDDPVVDGITFDSRHGNDLRLYAIFERPGTSDPGLDRSVLVDVLPDEAIDSASDDFQAALALHNLQLG